MATRLYFINATNTQPGIFPTVKQSARTQSAVSGSGNQVKDLRLIRGTAQNVHTCSSLAVTAAQSDLLGTFCTLPLNLPQTIGGGGATLTLNTAEAESSLNANFWINQLCVYVWRPSTGANVGFVYDVTTPTSLGGTEPATANAERVSHVTGIATTAVNALAGDVIICEVWARFSQSSITSYVVSFYFSGTTENTTENATVTNHASYLEFSSNITFSNKRGNFLSF